MFEAKGSATVKAPADKVLPAIDGFLKSQGLHFNWDKQPGTWRVSGPLSFPTGEGPVTFEQIISVEPGTRSSVQETVLTVTYRVADTSGLSDVALELLRTGIDPEHVAAAWAPIVEAAVARERGLD